MKHIYTSLDIGSDSIKVVVCELYQNKLNLLASASYPSKGIHRGLIVDPDGAKECISNAIHQVEEILGMRVDEVIATVPSYEAEFTVVKGELEVKDEDGNVSRDDIYQVLDQAVASTSFENRSIVTAIPVDYTLDGVAYQSEPLHMPGQSLKARAIVVTVPEKSAYSVMTLLDSIGINVIDISLSGIGDLYAFKNKTMEKNVGAIINIGGDITTVSLYNRGIIVKNAIINMGGVNVDKDISYMYKTPLDVSEDLKRHFALGNKRNASTSDMHEIETEVDNALRINQFEISEVVASRLEEILNLAKDKINILTSKRIDYIIITGGMSNMADIEYTANEVFKRSINIGNIRLVGIRDNKYSSAVGSIVYFISKMKLKGQDLSMVSDEDAAKLASIRKSYQEIHNDQMLGKLMEYFLANRRI